MAPQPMIGGRYRGRGRSLWTRPLLAVVFALGLAALSCTGEPGQDLDSGTPDAPSSDTTSSEVPPSEAPSSDVAAGPADTATWTVGVTSAPPDVGAPPLPMLTALRTGSQPDYERMVVEIGPEASGRPGYQVEYIDRPLVECGSGRQIFPVGDAWLELRLEPAAAHTEEGRPTLGARELPLDGPLLRRVYRTCDFEGVVVFVMALAEPNPYRVFTLTDPWRIVVDVER